MTKVLDLTGRQFGRLTVECRHHPDHVTIGGNSLVVWKCLCSCGRATETLAASLLQGKTKSCGCLLFDRAVEQGKSNTKHGDYSSSASYEDRVKRQALANIKERSRRRGYESDLEIDDLPLLTQTCPVLGIKYSRGSLKDKNASPSIDRKKPNLPYLKKYKDNLIFISHRANRIKADATPDEIRKVLEYIEAQG